MSYKVYLVEDEENLNHLLYSYLAKEGWEVESFLTGSKAKKAIPDNPHLWILDIMLPDIDGYQLIDEIKDRYPRTPVIFISARDDSLDRVLGLEKGSDDYLAKPFLPRELIIRSNKLLERVYKGEKTIDEDVISLPYIIDIKKRKVLNQQKEEIPLTSKEFDLLLFFTRHKQQALSRKQILSHVWDTNYVGTERVVDDLVRRLRKKLLSLNLETLYGYGYRLVESK
ncbi:response regulator [Iocasia frigidifontis]|uniref:Stage 0 sporulation protein A homolog n=1 Tax=Iocasia fonsfrigidae TaxID=2682810 RepID=A0A8A7KGB4_9FIRM|nr:response regulator transcription factor [Iocasia fonsfrigidae]QTL98748.1 response regulator [Iocasia fonsfrigidae]